MVTLREELYRAQRKASPHREKQVQSPTQSSAIGYQRKTSFLRNRETVPTRRFSSYDPYDDVSYLNDLPGSASTNRNSISSPQIPALLEKSPRPEEELGEEMDIRCRFERRFSLQPWQYRHSNTFVHREPDSSDDSPDLGFKPDSPSPDKKKSIWSWKPLRALSRIGRQRFRCVFSAYAHSIEGLPPAMNGLRLCVHLRKEETKEGAVQTMPSRVFQGIAEIEETLFMKCTLFSSKNPTGASQFMSKAFIVSVIAPDVEELDLGKHQLDLSRLHADSGESAKGRSWDTALELSGKAKGGKLIISFDYKFIDKDFAASGNLYSRFRDSRPRQLTDRGSYSLPNSVHGTPRHMAKAYSMHSPTSCDEYDEHRLMEHFILDEPFSVSSACQAVATEVISSPTFHSKSARPSASCDVSHASPYFEPTLNNFTHFNLDAAFSNRKHSLRNSDCRRDSTDQALEDHEASIEYETEFTVIDKGIEIDKLIIDPTNNGSIGMRNGFCNSVPPFLERLDKKEVDSTPVPEEGMHDCKKGATNLVEILGNGFAKNEIHEDGKERAVIWQHGDKKAAVTYHVIMHTLESILEGTTKNEQHYQGDSLQETSPDGKKAGDTVSNQERAACRKAINVASAQGMNEESDNLVTRRLEGAVIEVSKQQELHDNLDQEVDLVAGKFLEMLETGDHALKQNSDSEPDSPRAQLLKQFEQEALLEGGFGLDLSLLLDNAAVSADQIFS